MRIKVVLFLLLLVFSFLMPQNDFAKADSFRISANQTLLESERFSRLQPRVEIGGIGNLIYHEGLYQNHLILKFENFIPIRLTRAPVMREPQRGVDLSRGISLDNRLRDLNTSPQTREPIVNPATAGQLAYVPNLQNDRERKLMNQAGISTELVINELKTVNQLLSGSSIRTVEPLFSRPIQDLDNERRNLENLSGIEAADLSNYYHIEVIEGANSSGILGRLNSLKIVETVYFAPIPEPADIPPPTDSFEGDQGYLNAAPVGIDARFAWTINGGKGQGIRIFDIEAGWETKHEDIPGDFPLNGLNSPFLRDRNHGTAVFGEMVALDDGSGVTGIANRSGFGAVSVARFPGNLELRFVANAISVATALLRPGDVILIEQHARGRVRVTFLREKLG